MVFLGVAAVAALVPVLIVLLVIFGIPLTGLTIWIVQNGKLLAIVTGIIIAFMIIRKK